MMANPSQQLSQCQGKHAYDSRSQALLGVQHRLRKMIAPYHCDVCGCWHVGNQNTKRKVELAKRKLKERKQDASTQR